MPTGGCRAQGQVSVPGCDPPVPSFSPWGGRAGSQLPALAVCWPAAAARQGILAAQGNVAMSWHSLPPQGPQEGQRNGVSRACFQPEGITSFFSLWRLLGFLLLFCFVFPSFSPPQHICTEWEMKAAVNEVLAHRKVLEHPPSSCTASTWENFWESFKLEFFYASVCV